MIGTLITDESIALAVASLSQDDGRLAAVFDAVGKISLPRQSLEFGSVCRIIINQQLSGKAADTIFRRIQERIPNLTPQNVLMVADEELRSCGVSGAKVNYLKLLAEKIEDNPSYFDALVQMETGAAKEVIWSNKGFGEWSSEIFLLFHLKRADVFPKGDVTLNKVTAKIYGIDPIDVKRIYELSEAWSPYRSVVSLAFWQFFDLGLLESR